MSGFSRLGLSQKLLLGGIMATCGGIFILNNGSHDLQRRRVRDADKLLQTGKIPPGSFGFQDYQLVIPPELRTACKSFEPSPFFETTWSPKFIRDNLTLNINNWEQGRWYTLFTCGFNHSSLGHIFFNMIALSSIAPLFIFTQGTFRFLSLWMTSSAMGGLLTLRDNKSKAAMALEAQPPDTKTAQRYINSNAVGASCSIMGLVGATAVLHPQVSWQIMFLPFRISSPVLVGFTIAGSLLANGTGVLPGIGHWGHIGGMTAGLAFGYFMRSRPPPSLASMIPLLTYSVLYSPRSTESTKWKI